MSNVPTTPDPNEVIAEGLTRAQLTDLRDKNPVLYARIAERHNVTIPRSEPNTGDGAARYAAMHAPPAPAVDPSEDPRMATYRQIKAVNPFAAAQYRAAEKLL